MDNKIIPYHLKLITTQSQTGYFSVVPESEPTLQESLTILRRRPFDDFFHKYVLSRIGEMTAEQMNRLLITAKEENDETVQALLLEHLLLAQGRSGAEGSFSPEEISRLAEHTPLINIRSVLTKDRSLHTRWIGVFRDNMFTHAPLPSPEASGLEPLADAGNRSRGKTIVSITDIRQSFVKATQDAPVLFSAQKTAEIAEQRLKKAGVHMEEMMRHESSLSPIGLLRKWRVHTRVDNKRNRFSFTGEQTSYGKGLTPDDAKASLMMEIVERCSAFASISQDGVLNLTRPYPVRYARYSELKQEKVSAVNPNDLALEIPYGDEPLHWVCGETPGKDDPVDAWIPLQCIFLFCNMDEQALFSSLGSTGFASGNTLEQAKVSALLEVIERHQESTMPVDRSTFFRFVSKHEKIAPLLALYGYHKVSLQFQDITGPMGIPCCRCFVTDPAGTIQKGAAAGLSAKKAIISAITETTHPFPNGPASQPVPRNLIVVDYEDLPDYSTGDPKSDLALLESLLEKNNYRPYYIDLTRADIGLPVVRAIIPGMEIVGDFDDYSRVHPELFGNYLALFK